MGRLYKLYRQIRKPLGIVRRYCRDKVINRIAYSESLVLNKFMIDTIGHKRVFYLGRTENNNLGDNAQHYCIKKWISENYGDRDLYIVPSSIITAKKKYWLKVFCIFFDNEKDIIIFQSGYSVQDLGGDHPFMHELICESLPKAKILMMPQTIYFQHEHNRNRTAKNHDAARNMLFLARDEVSYKQALDMFPHIKVKLFPDIVTTLIGKYQFNNNRDRIFLCCRNDGEKYYTLKEIDTLRSNLENLSPVDYGDTQSKLSGNRLRKVLKYSLEREFERLSRYKVVITDRYHGTIFSLIANTPVIILKTKDHKVTTGANWFSSIYDKYVYVAEDLSDAYKKAEEIHKHFDYIKLESYFDTHFYRHLKEIFEEKNL